jgi:RNA polymerase sigma-70 factor, ECF subfamily
VSTAVNFVGRAKTRTNSRPLPDSRARSRNAGANSCELPGRDAHQAIETHVDTAGREAFEQMFVASRPKFVAMARGILRNREDAEDAVQNSFLSGYLHLRSFEGRSALSTWFTRIVLNAALMIQRKRKRLTIQSPAANNEWDDAEWTENLPASEPDPEVIHAEREILHVVDGILGKMKPALRQAFTMTYFDELSGPEACAVLDLPAETYKARLFRAKRQVFDQTKRTLGRPASRTMV